MRKALREYDKIYGKIFLDIGAANGAVLFQARCLGKYDRLVGVEKKAMTENWRADFEGFQNHEEEEAKRGPGRPRKRPDPIIQGELYIWHDLDAAADMK